MIKSKEMKKTVFIDIEGTGLDTDFDEIIEISYFVFEGEKFISKTTNRHNCARYIPQEVSDLTGIKKSDIENEPEFSQLAEHYFESLSNCVLVGYNLLKYDIPILMSSFARAGYKWPNSDVQVIDLFKVWQKSEPRNLTSALKRFAGIDLENAHSAEADTEHLPDLMSGQMKHFGIDKDKMLELTDEGFVDYAGIIGIDKDNDYIYNIGKNTRGTKVKDNLNMADWILNNDFKADTKEKLSKIIDEIVNENDLFL